MKPSSIAATAWHARTAADVLAELATSPEGLSEADVSARRQTFGANVLPRPRRRSTLLLYVHQFRNPLIYLLIIACAISLAIGEWTDAAFILAVLQINAILGTLQEWKAEASAAALQDLIPRRVPVRREGELRLVDSVDLVPGDIVRLDSGAMVPADLRLLSSRELKVDEAPLTGESLPAEKDAHDNVPETAPVGDRRTMLHAGTTVQTGRAEGVVVRTGAGTEVGRIAEALVAQPAPLPPLVVRLERFTRAIAVFVVAACAVIGVALFLKGLPPAQVFLVMVALAVAAIPEGLPIAITVALSVGSARMARRNVIVRRLPAVEGLGACTVIASDKTGTLTANELTLRAVWFPNGGDVEVEGRGYSPRGRCLKDGVPVSGPMEERLRDLATAGSLANEATLEWGDGSAPRLLGDSVDIAFLAFAAKLGLDREAIRRSFPEVGTIPYESARGFAARFHRAGGTCVAAVKGAAEALLPMCVNVDKSAVLLEVDRMAARGFRVLAVAQGPIEAVGDADDSVTADIRGLQFLGLVGLIDPVRPEAAEAVRTCRQAGIDVRVVTGDHPATALAIARSVGLAAGEDDVIRGSELAAAGDGPDYDGRVARGCVFARVEPVQKLAIVRSLQRSGHFVAVTGDGVNDAPALHQAHIGVAMGKGGTDVARGAADLILTDDNFASIVGGIEEGRIAYDNVRKVSYLLLSTGAAEIVLFFLAVAFDRPVPFFAAQLLWLNLVTHGFQSIALSFERGESGVLGRRPRPPGQALFDRRMIEEVALSALFIGTVGFLFFSWTLANGWAEADARNAVLLWMVACQNIHGFNCRSETRSTFRIPFAANPFLVIAVIVAHGVHIGAMYAPGLSDLLALKPVSFDVWLRIAGMALGLIVVMELYKLARPRDP
jgi:magnesium-transporting ATPase (P-type)